MAKRYRTRAIKTHRSYTVVEAAAALRVHSQTVRDWIKRGLRALTNERPTLILGSDLKAFVEHLNQAKRPLGPNELYCLECRKASEPWGGLADYTRQSGRPGRLSGLCPECEQPCHRFVAEEQIATVAPDLEVALAAAETSLNEHASAPANAHKQEGGQTCANAANKTSG